MGALLFVVLLPIAACMASKQETNLTKNEAIRIAEKTATSEGYDIQKYNITGCKYVFTEKDKTWTVFYELKPPTPPGGHFVVSVNDNTKKATISAGE